MEFWSRHRVLVTGITGLAGVHLGLKLADAKARVIGLVRDRIPFDRFHRSGLADRVTQVDGSCEDAGLMKRILNEYDISAVFHLAAQTQVTLAVADPASTFEANIRGTWSLLEATRAFPQVKGILVASSDKAYGASSALPYSEETPLRADAPYDVSKACADLLAHAYARTYNLPVVVTRCANLFGEGDLQWNRLIPEALRAWMEARAPRIRSDGRPKRDYLYAGDAADALLLLMQRRLENRLAHTAYNVSASQPLTVLELVERLKKLLEKRFQRVFPPPEILATARHEIPEQWLSAERLRSETGWKPAHTLDEALEKTLAYYVEFLDFGVKASSGA